MAVPPDKTIMEFRHHVHFFFHARNDPEFAEQERDCHWCQLATFTSHRSYPISIVFGSETTAVIPQDFRFIEENVLREGVQPADAAFESGCNCTDDVQCMLMTADNDPNGCLCLQDVDRENMAIGAKLNAYHVFGQRAGCLRGHKLESRDPVYECNARCSCSQNCPNRVVGNGRKVNLQIFNTTDGRVRATEDIRRGQYVGSYVGEVITPAEADRRRDGAGERKKKDIYLFALDKFSQDSPDSNKAYEIDGEYMSGPTRFINHSCSPNLRIFAVVNELANKALHGLCFFATKEIPRNTELTFDYTDGVKRSDEVAGTGRKFEDMSASEKNKELFPCLCGASNCRGYLW
ncbi:unnamed protein product [Diplocarpon coronariae]|uniref:Histone-lysine N-methyltransferase n=1 Tax=Diplocarpon coronariae TaxID=2795749 RepID=A0A218ZDF1_9HELO|nr:histone-lysine N-methyltransferase [Marssonina coronariae]